MEWNDLTSSCQKMIYNLILETKTVGRGIYSFKWLHYILGSVDDNTYWYILWHLCHFEKSKLYSAKTNVNHRYISETNLIWNFRGLQFPTNQQYCIWLKDFVETESYGSDKTWTSRLSKLIKFTCNVDRLCSSSSTLMQNFLSTTMQDWLIY